MLLGPIRGVARTDIKSTPNQSMCASVAPTFRATKLHFVAIWQ
jgi:hypothetical protein